MNGELAFLLERLLPVLNEGVLMSLKLIIPSSVLGLAFGVVVGACRAFGGGPVKALANGYATLTCPGSRRREPWCRSWWSTTNG